MKIGSRGRNSYFGKVGRAGPGELLGRMKGLQCDVFRSPLRHLFCPPSLIRNVLFLFIQIRLNLIFSISGDMRVGVAWAGSDSLRQRESPSYMFLYWKGQKVTRTPQESFISGSYEDQRLLFSPASIQMCTSPQSSISLSLSLELRLWSWLLSHTGNSAFSQRRVSFSQFYFFLPSSLG